ncbi:hypothetical protein DFJ58DRAFT_869767 [Suillus subalutaceus]|uniref:uncharacterized protein n=1 Tax=Suillus subalutaceus TaxID=48586 RepID=UPI001B879468|nr:uncharacterized protein DFJ58DRAFT_869767 [Suillus subalutaceus]KAG1862739.1 hypothetical protein DFJ58DRAFT_869767 [Suillus subalutaceus]
MLTRDAESLKRLLNDKFNYPKANVVLMKNDVKVPKDLWPSRDNILKEITQLVTSASANDYCFFYSFETDSGSWVFLADLDEAIQFHRDALVLCPPGHSGRFSSLNNLAVSLRVRVEQRGVLADLDEAIDLHRAALALRSPVHSHRSLASE